MYIAETNKRVKWVDVLKGIGIFLVVMGHNQTSKYLGTYFSSFHMPLFFLIAGYLYDSEKYNGFVKLIKSRTKGIIVPFLFFSLLSLVMYMGLSIVRSEVIEWTKLISQFIVHGITPLNSPLWFLRILFIVEIAFYFLKKFSKNDFLLSIYLIIFLTISFNNNVFGLDGEVTRSFNALFFYGLGNLIRGKRIEFNNYTKISFLLLALVVGNIIVSKSVKINLYLAISLTTHFVYFFLAACCGIIMCYILARLINKSKVLEYLGKNSLIILSTHILIKIVLSYVSIYIFRIPKSIGANPSDLIALVYTVIILLLCVPVIELFNRYLPIVLGRTNKNKPVHLRNIQLYSK